MAYIVTLNIYIFTFKLGGGTLRNNKELLVQKFGQNKSKNKELSELGHMLGPWLKTKTCSANLFIRLRISMTHLIKNMIKEKWIS